ncbi:MAG: hypothetical protein OHK0032_18830 [Thermodesulfovibrionales bacterium]
MRFRRLIRNINLLNIILMAAIAVFAAYILLPMFDVNVRYALPAAKKNIEGKEETASQAQAPAITEYTMIAEQNLFHPSRTIVAAKDAKPETRPEFVLYGTLITDDTSLAYLEDLKAPYTTQGRGKRQRALHSGATLSGFTLKEIHHNRVVMVRGEEQIVLNVSPRKRFRDVSTISISDQKPVAAPTALQEKPSGAGRPPGIIKRESPAEQAPPMLPKAREAIEDIIKQKLQPLRPGSGNQ